MLQRLSTNAVEAMHKCWEGYAPRCRREKTVLQRLCTNAAEAMHKCCGGLAPMLWRLCTNAGEAMHQGVEEKKTMNSVPNTFAMQPICNAARAAHTLRSDQKHALYQIHISLQNLITHHAIYL
jgi:hypothetical protein